MGKRVWLEITEKVHTLLKDGGIEVFRQQVRAAAEERLAAEDEKQRREDARRDYLIQHGTWVTRGQLPQRPDGQFIRCRKTFTGAIGLPSSIRLPMPGPTPVAPLPTHLANDPDRVAAQRQRVEEYRKTKAEYDASGEQEHLEKALPQIFYLAQQQGFPDDGNDAFRYKFDVEVWLPAELGAEYDPPTSGPLPVPNRVVSLAEKYAALAAIYDGRLAGLNKIAPWGVTSYGEGETLRVPTEDAEDFHAAAWYCRLNMAACQLKGAIYAESIRIWLAEVEADLTARKRGGTAENDDSLPAKQRKLAPSREKAKALYDWAMSAIAGTKDMTLAELYSAIECHPSNASDALPPSPATFGKYLRDAGVKRYGTRVGREGRSVRKPEDL